MSLLHLALLRHENKPISSMVRLMTNMLYPVKVLKINRPTINNLLPMWTFFLFRLRPFVVSVIIVHLLHLHTHVYFFQGITLTCWPRVDQMVHYTLWCKTGLTAYTAQTTRDRITYIQTLFKYFAHSNQVVCLQVWFGDFLYIHVGEKFSGISSFYYFTRIILCLVLSRRLCLRLVLHARWSHGREK